MNVLTLRTVAFQQVTIEYQKRDRYGRIVGKVLLDGIDACLEQIEAGFVWHYKKYQHEQNSEDQRLYADADNSTTDAALGRRIGHGQKSGRLITY